jgi:capsule polysaccharide modification protein KpsS
MNKRDGNIGRPPNRVCKVCGRKRVYPEKGSRHGGWRYPLKPICFDCLMIQNSLFEHIRTRKLPRKMDDNAKLLFPLIVFDTNSNTTVGQYKTKEEVLSAVAKYQTEGKSRSRILVIHHPTYYDYTDYFISVK